MTSKEALAFISKKAFNHIQASYPVFDEEGFENYDKSQMVLGVLIERDTPMKPIVNIDNEIYDVRLKRIMKEYNCGVCMCILDMPQNFCPKCGQRLDWGNE